MRLGFVDASGRWRCAVVAVALSAFHWTALAQTATAPAAASPGPDIVASGPAGQVTRAELEWAAAELIAPAEQAGFWQSPDAVSRMARSLYAQRVLAAEGARLGLDKTAQGELALRVAHDRALTDVLMRQRVKAATPDDSALDGMARSEYRANPARFALPEEVHVRHILLPMGRDEAVTRAEAQALVQQLRGGADFAAMARARSVDKASAQRGGDLGFFPKGKMAPEFEVAAFGLKQPGDVSEPVKSGFGYHIIELVERKPPSTQSFAQALPQLRQELTDKIGAEVRRSTWEQGTADVQVDDAAIKDWLQRRPSAPR